MYADYIHALTHHQMISDLDQPPIFTHNYTAAHPHVYVYVDEDM